MREGEEKRNQQVIKSGAHKVTKLERVTSSLTSDKKTEQQSQFSGDVSEDIFNAISDWVFLTDIKCRILKSNVSGEKFTGICPEEMIGKSCCKLIRGSAKHVQGCPFKKAIQTGRRTSAELWGPKSQRCLAITIDPIKDEKGRIKSAVHIVRDITQQKKVEESLKGSEEKFRNIFEYANDGITYLDSFGKILDVNEKVEQIFGSSRNELINKHFTKLGILSVKDIPNYISMFKDILKGKVANLTVPITNKKGRKLFLECSASLIKLQGESTRIMVISRDITGRKKAEEELRIKEKAISTSINAIAIAGLDGNLTYVNNAFVRMWGYDEAEEVLGRVSNHFWQAPEQLDGRMKAFSHGGGWIDEVPAQRRDGSFFVVQLSTSIVLNQAGEPCNIMTSFIDITERKKAEKKLKESEERFKSVFENTLVGLYRTTPDGRILMANPALIQMLGYSSFEELAKRNLEEGGFEPDYSRLQFKQLVESKGRVGGLESVWYKQDGTVLYIRESARAIRDNDGNTLYYEGTVENITERKRAEEALQKEHTLLRLLIDNIPDRIYLKDRKHRFIIGNDTIVKYEGFQDEKDLLGKTDFDLYPKELAECYCEVEKKIIQKNQPLINKEELFVNKQGSEQWTLTTKLPLQDKSGKIIGIVGIHRDITELKQAEQARREAETKYRKLFGNLNVGIYRVTPGDEGRFIDVNPAYIRLLGYEDKAEVLKLKVSDTYIDPSQRALYNEKITTNGFVKNEELLLKKKDGTPIIVSDTGTGVYDKSGKLICFEGILEDITTRKLAQELLERSEEKYRDLIEKVKDIIYTLDDKGNITFASPAVETILGYRPEEMEGKNFLILIPEEWREKAENDFKNTLKTGGTTAETVLLDKKGHPHFVEFNSTFIKEGDKIIGTRGIVRDITERKKAEQELRKSEERYRRLAENAPDIIYRMSVPDGKYEYINSATLSILGYSPEEFYHNDCLVKQIIHPNSQEYLQEQWGKLLKGEVPPTYDYQCIHKSGEMRWLNQRNILIRDDTGSPIAIEGIVTDITERKQAEEALRESEKRFIAAQHIARTGDFTWNVETGEVTWSDALYDLLHYDRSEKIDFDKVSSEIHHPDDLESINQWLSDCIASDKAELTPNEYRLVRKDGEIIYVRIVGIIEHGDGKQPKIFATVQDVTERKQAEQALRESEERYRGIFNNSSVALWEMDFSDIRKYVYSLVDNGNSDIYEYLTKNRKSRYELINRIKLRDVNKTTLKIFKSNSREELFDKFGMLLTTCSCESFLRCIERYVSGDTTYSAEQIHYTVTGEEIQVRLTSTIMPGSEKTWDKVLVTVVDITQMKKLEQELRTSQAQLSEALKIAKLAYWEYDVIENMFTFNDQFYNVYHTSTGQVGGYKMSPERYARLFLYSEDMPLLQGEIQRAIEAKEPNMNFQAEHRFKYGDGKPGYISINYFVIKDDNGRTIKTYGVSQDITERKQTEQALIEREELFRTFIEQAPEGICVHDLNGNILIANDMSCKYTGYSKQEALKMNVAEVDASVIEQEHRRKFWEKLCVGECSIVESVHKRKDKSTFPAEVQISKIIFNRKPMILAFIRDITERKQAEESLRVSERRLSEGAKIAKLGYWENDIVNRLFTFSDHFYEILHTSADEVGGYKMSCNQYLDTFIHPDDRKRVEAKCLDIFKNPDSQSSNYLEHRIIYADGEIGHVAVRFSIVKDDHGRIIKTYGVNQDITERKKAEENMAKTAKFPEENPNPVLRLSKDWTIIYSNRAGSAILETLNREVGESLPEAFDRRLRKAVRTGHISTFDFTCRDGRIFELKLVPIVDMGYINIYGLDITKRKEVERNLRDYHIQLQSLASQLTLTEERERRRIATALHDQISQPLAISKIKIEELLRSEIKDNSHKILINVRDWLSKAMMDTRLLTSNLSSPVLYELGFEKAVASWLDEEIRGKHNIMSELSVDGKLKYIDDDIRALLFRDVKELLFNIVKHARARKVKVSINKVSNMIRVNVEDDGIGFEPAKLSSTKGAAFGLFSIRERLEHMGGRFEIDSALGSGCRITMLVPSRRKKALDGENK